MDFIQAEGSPKPRGPYTPAIRAGDFIFLSAQGPVDPKTNEFCHGDIKQETALVLNNIKQVLKAAGASIEDIVKCSVFLCEGKDFAEMNEVYEQFFGGHKPTRTTIEAKFANPKMKVLIDCVAYKPK